MVHYTGSHDRPPMQVLYDIDYIIATHIKLVVQNVFNESAKYIWILLI